MSTSLSKARLFAFAAAVLAAGQLAGLAQTTAARPGGNAAGRSSYVLGSGDLLTVRALNVPEITDKPIRIDPDGNINFPMVGRIHAAGMTAEQLEAEIFNRLKVYLNDPQVSVDVTEHKSQPVSVFGEVSSPGVHQLDGRKTLIEILAMVGGVRPSAGPTIRITRRLEYGRIPLAGAADDSSAQFSVAEVEIRPLIDAKSPDKDIEIQPYDVISVPKAEMIYVGGDVAKVGSVNLTEARSISIMEALSSSGGVLKTSAPQKSRILRSVAGSAKRDQIPVDISKILNGQSEDVQLQAGDILFIPSSIKSKATSRALEAVIQTAMVALTYGIVR